MSNKDKMIAVRLEAELIKRIKALAEANEQTVSQFVRLAIKKYIDKK
jgi:predicted DNA-binding protein